MDKNAIKKYAVWARRELISRVSQRAAIYGIDDKNTGNSNDTSVNGRVLSETEIVQRRALINQIKNKGYEQVMEEVAYTWFNRFSALRFMEVNGYLPSHVRVFTDDDNAFKPQILTEAINLEIEGIDMEKVYGLKNANDDDELFKYLIILQCNSLNTILPRMFQKIEDFTELLFPDNLLREGSVIERLISDIPEENFNVSTDDGQIEIIGWLYQYYISEKHEEVVDPLHGKVVKKEEIPAATQLFTTDWVVRYIVDNSIGRYWIERNPSSSLKEELTYYIKHRKSEDVFINQNITPQMMTVFDPCVGSGHFLIYSFDVLMKIYAEYGYSDREAASEIVKHNLFGLDIDGRASQLAYFSIMMKGRQYDARFFKRNIQPNVYEIKESNDLDAMSIDYFCEHNVSMKKDIHAILSCFVDAKEYGSILHMPKVDYNAIFARFDELKNEISMFNQYLFSDFKNMIQVAYLLSSKYVAVVTNPPYLNKYDDKLKAFINENYKEYSGDIFSVFVYRNFDFCIKDGYTGYMTPFVWMFIKTYENLRRFIVDSKQLVSLIQMEYSAFEEATVPICSYVLKNGNSTGPGLYFKLSDFKGGMEVQKQKVLEGISDENCEYYFETDQKEYTIIPSCSIAFWATRDQLNAFKKGKTIGELYKTITGSSTGENARFLRLWYELDINKIGFNLPETYSGVGFKWIPCNKGGAYRKWFGNQDYVINWENDGVELKEFATYKNHGKHWSRFLKSLNCFYHPGITWSKITSGSFSARYMPNGFIMESAANAIMPDEKDMNYLLAIMNSSIVQKILRMLNPTINMQAGDITSIPIIQDPSIRVEIEKIAEECLRITKEDWDSFEVSWNFKKHPLIGKYSTIKDAYKKWEEDCDKRFVMLKENEETINRLLLKAYNMENEDPAIAEDSISIRRADLEKDIKSLISYAVGCMFGRYSLDKEGVIYAGGQWDEKSYHTFLPDKDNIIPVCDDEYFDDDIVGMFIEFIKVAYGESTLDENLAFIAEALGKKGTPKMALREYFLNEFYIDHCSMCSVSASGKRPYYWLFDSGKKGGFRCLIYMHRYHPDTIARIRTDYVHEQQSRYRTAIVDLEKRIPTVSTSERVRLNRNLKLLKDQAEEIRKYEEKIHHLADQMIQINLDDGLKTNYEKFQSVLAKLK